MPPALSVKPQPPAASQQGRRRSLWFRVRSWFAEGGHRAGGTQPKVQEGTVECHFSSWTKNGETQGVCTDFDRLTLLERWDLTIPHLFLRHGSEDYLARARKLKDLLTTKFRYTTAVFHNSKTGLCSPKFFLKRWKENVEVELRF